MRSLLSWECHRCWRFCDANVPSASHYRPSVPRSFAPLSSLLSSARAIFSRTDRGREGGGGFLLFAGWSVFRDWWTILSLSFSVSVETPSNDKGWSSKLKMPYFTLNSRVNCTVLDVSRNAFNGWYASSICVLDCEQTPILLLLWSTIECKSCVLDLCSRLRFMYLFGIVYNRSPTETQSRTPLQLLFDTWIEDTN